VRAGYLANTTRELVEEQDIDLVVTSTVGKSGNPHWLSGGISSKLMRQITKPVLLVQTTDEQAHVHPRMARIMVSLDGSILAENTLPYARAIAKAFDSEIILLAVPQVPEVKDYRAPDMAVTQIRQQMEDTMENFLDAVGRSLREDGVRVRTITKGSLPVRTIVSTAEEEQADMILLTSRGRGGIDRIFMGSVAESVVAESDRAVLMVPRPRKNRS
jgi:nucleotide-binding universal stress UspA family protein